MNHWIVWCKFIDTAQLVVQFAHTAWLDPINHSATVDHLQKWYSNQILCKTICRPYVNVWWVLIIALHKYCIILYWWSILYHFVSFYKASHRTRLTECKFFIARSQKSQSFTWQQLNWVISKLVLNISTLLEMIPIMSLGERYNMTLTCPAVSALALRDKPWLS